MLAPARMAQTFFKRAMAFIGFSSPGFFWGSFEDDQLSVILPNAHVGDFVEVGTYHGRLLGEVTAVLPSPHPPSIALEGLNSVKVTVYDPMHILQPRPHGTAGQGEGHLID